MLTLSHGLVSEINKHCETNRTKKKSSANTVTDVTAVVVKAEKCFESKRSTNRANDGVIV